VYFVGVGFLFGGKYIHIFSGQVEAKGVIFVVSHRAGSSGIQLRIHSMVKKSLHRHRAGFEPQRAPPFMKGKSPPNTRRSRPSLNGDPTLFVLLFTLLLVLASFTSGDQQVCVIATLCRPPPHQDWGRAGTAHSRFARDDKELGPQLAGGQLPKEPPLETAET
jgi:hypothetical protein